jgi:SAM-dependent methyltransferase
MPSNGVYHNRVYVNTGIPALVELVDSGEGRVLDIGCGTGGNLRLLADRGHEGVGVTLSAAEAGICRADGLECHVADLTAGLPFRPRSFDAVILSHVLEHMAWPEEALRAAMTYVRPAGGVYIAVPNSLFLPQRVRFLCGEFRYTETGIMDRTHLRFFDHVTIRELAEASGLTVTAQKGVGFVPQGPVRRLAPRLAGIVDRWGASRWPSLLALHLLVVGRVPS